MFSSHVIVWHTCIDSSLFEILFFSFICFCFSLLTKEIQASWQLIFFFFFAFTHHLRFRCPSSSYSLSFFFEFFLINWKAFITIYNLENRCKMWGLFVGSFIYAIFFSPSFVLFFSPHYLLGNRQKEVQTVMIICF